MICQNSMNKAVFLDRDGVINREKNYLFRIEEFEFLPGVFESCKLLEKIGFLLVIITNQSGIGRGYYSEKEFHVLNSWMLNKFKDNDTEIKRVYFCPHHPLEAFGGYKIPCKCRKPNPGMVLRASHELNINLEKSIVIGDKETDIEAGKGAGVGLNILVRSGHKIVENSTKADYIIDSLGCIEDLMKIEKKFLQI